MTATLETIAETVLRERLGPPAIVVVGDVVRLRDNLQWFEQRPLFGRCIVNTRSRAQASVLTARLESLGAEVAELPTIEIVPAGNDSELGLLVKGNLDYDWILFASPNGVRAFFDLVLKAHGDIRALGRARIGCIGPGTTAAVESYCVKASVTAKEAVAEGLIAALKPIGPWKGRRVLLPRAEQARDVLPRTLGEWGADVTVLPAYRTIAPAATIDPDPIERIKTGTYDLITFSSSSTVHNFAALLSTEGPAGLNVPLRAASIGPVTSATLRDYGVKPLVEAAQHTIPGLAHAIREYFAG
jgi:uroporphyrinogen III methyltransferase/synthase